MAKVTGHKIREIQMGEACGMYGELKCMHSFGGET
jgi:hypothetical protein